MPTTRPLAPATNSWTKAGMQPRAVLPSRSGSVGTSRQPRTRQPLLGGQVSDVVLRLGHRLGVARDERGADGICRDRRQLERAHVSEERVRHLHQDAGTITRVGLGAGRAAVLEVAQRREGFGDDVVRRRRHSAWRRTRHRRRRARAARRRGLAVGGQLAWAHLPSSSPSRARGWIRCGGAAGTTLALQCCGETTQQQRRRSAPPPRVETTFSKASQAGRRAAAALRGPRSPATRRRGPRRLCDLRRSDARAPSGARRSAVARA